MGQSSHKSPWATSNGLEPLETPAFTDLVNRMVATRFLAAGLPLKYGTPRQLRDRIGKQIKTACGNGDLKSQNGQFLFGDLVAWAKTKRQITEAVANLNPAGTGFGSSTLDPLKTAGFSYSLPATLDQCHSALRDAYRELDQLRNENESQNQEVVSLRPLQSKAAARSASASEAGKKGGRPKKS